MKCAYLSGKFVLSCTAEKGFLYVPSLFELEEYCRTARSARCPLSHAPGTNEQAVTDQKVYGRWSSPRW